MEEEKAETQYLGVFYFSRFIFKTFAVGPLLTGLVRKEKSNSIVKQVKVLPKITPPLEVG